MITRCRPRVAGDEFYRARW